MALPFYLSSARYSGIALDDGRKVTTKSSFDNV